MKIVSYLLLCVLASVSLAGYDDGFITEGEYEYGVEIFGDNTLIVEGGGADGIEMWGNSRLEVHSTSTPLGNSGGIYDIFLYDSGKILYLGGITEELTLYKDATAILRGGRIDYITLYRRPQDSCLVTIECQSGWSWLYTSGQKTGITGLWENGTMFDIDFIDVDAPYPATWNYINIKTVPEPTTAVFIGLGYLLIRKKKIQIL